MANVTVFKSTDVCEDSSICLTNNINNMKENIFFHGMTSLSTGCFYEIIDESYFGDSTPRYYGDGNGHTTKEEEDEIRSYTKNKQQQLYDAAKNLSKQWEEKYDIAITWLILDGAKVPNIQSWIANNLWNNNGKYPSEEHFKDFLKYIVKRYANRNHKQFYMFL